MKELEKQYKALANRRRLLILKFLKDGKKANVTAIADYLRLSLKATSKHLRILSVLDIVEKEQKSLSMEYYLSSKQQPVIAFSLKIL